MRTQRGGTAITVIIASDNEKTVIAPRTWCAHNAHKTQTRPTGARRHKAQAKPSGPPRARPAHGAAGAQEKTDRSLRGSAPPAAPSAKAQKTKRTMKPPRTREAHATRRKHARRERGARRSPPPTDTRIPGDVRYIM